MLQIFNNYKKSLDLLHEHNKWQYGQDWDEEVKFKQLNLKNK